MSTRGPMRRPTKAELLAALDQAEAALLLMVGEAFDGIEDAVRDRLGEIVIPLTDLLRRAGLRR